MSVSSEHEVVMGYCIVRIHSVEKLYETVLVGRNINRVGAHTELAHKC